MKCNLNLVVLPWTDPGRGVVYDSLDRSAVRSAAYKLHAASTEAVHARYCPQISQVSSYVTVARIMISYTQHSISSQRVTVSTVYQQSSGDPRVRALETEAVPD